ncbi:MAG: D-alanyl-D-alanine carboxypeptidase/D-alanyl-D-alanine-endopeptidase [Vulcanimicrobiaceae bacterium]
MQNRTRYGTRSRRWRVRRRRRILLVCVAVLFAVAAAFGIWRLRAATSAPPVAANPVPSPPPALYSFVARRPPPAAPWTAQQRSSLQASVDGALAPAVDGADAYSLAVLDQTGRLLFGRAQTRAVTPASVQKILVGSVALATLGPSFHFHTLLTGREYPDANGDLGGDLFFVGSGDPSFRSDALDRGVAQLAREGIKHVNGVVVDASAFHGPEVNPHWDAGDVSEDYAAPTSPVSLDGDTVEFHVIGGNPGEPARVTFFPDSDFVSTTGAIQTSSAGEDDVTIGGTQAPNAFHLSGALPAGVEEKFWLPVYGIPRYVGSVLDRMLERYGVAHDVPPRVGVAPLGGVVFWDHRSPDLPVLVHHMLVLSDNHFAEQLLRTLGSTAGRFGSDDAAGIAVERRVLDAAGIPIPGLHLLDGSGLSADNRVAAITLASTLARFEPGLYLLLPQGGREGTLKHYDFTTALGRVRAKTGHLGNVASLAGYVNTMHHGRVTFAFLVDGSPGDPDAAFVRAIDRIAAL